MFLNIGSAVMGPEVYLKALAMARNVAHQQGEQICRFTTAVFDLPDERRSLVTAVAEQDEASWTADGIDRVAFLVSTNPGAPEGPLGKIASGAASSGRYCRTR